MSSDDPNNDDLARLRLRQRLVRGSIWGIVARGLGIVSLVALNVLLARSLSATDFAAFGMIASVLVFLRWCAVFGLNNLVLRLVSESVATGNGPRARRAIAMSRNVGAVATIGTSLIVYGVLSVWGGQLLPVGRPRVVALLVAAILGCSAVIQLLADTLRGFHELRLGSFLMGRAGGPLCNALFAALFGVVVLWSVPTLEVALLVQAASLAAVIPLGWVWIRRTIGRNLPPTSNAPTKVAHQQLSYRIIVTCCLPLCLTQLLFCTSNQVDIWMSGAFCTPERVADYVASKRMIMMILVPATLLRESVVSSIPELFKQGQLGRLERVLRTTATISAVPAVAVLLALAVFPTFFLSLAFGPKYASASGVLTILAAGQIVVLLAGNCQVSLMMTGYERALMVFNAASTVFLVVVGSLAAMRYGVIGLSMASAVATGLRCICAWAYTRLRVGVWTHPTVSLWRSWLPTETRQLAQSGTSRT